MNEFGCYVRRCRENKKMSLREFARRLGKSASYISDLERGNRNCKSSELLYKIGSVLDLANLHKLFILADMIPDNVIMAYNQQPYLVYCYCVEIMESAKKNKQEIYNPISEPFQWLESWLKAYEESGENKHFSAKMVIDWINKQPMSSG